MTRVNLVDPKYLSDQHLMAERLELSWIPGSAERSYHSKRGLHTVPSYRLGEGHVSFFHDKLGYIEKRFHLLTEEMKRRGMKPKMEFVGLHCPTDMNKDYAPTADALTIIKKRIHEKLMMKPEWYRYYGKPIDSKFMEYYL